MRRETPILRNRGSSFRNAGMAEALPRIHNVACFRRYESLRPRSWVLGLSRTPISWAG